MRLWHYKLIPVLPRQQLLGQWRECCLIAKNLVEKGTPNHILVNKITEYSPYNFISYCSLVAEEMCKRGYKLSYESSAKLDYYTAEWRKTWKKNCSHEGSGLFPGWHNYRYFVQCYYNLEEKYDCGGITDEEWDKIQEVADGMIRKEFEL